MNAIKFIKYHGVDKARECIEEANAYGGFWVNAKTLELFNQIPLYDAVSIPELSRLVESIKLVKEHYTLDGAIDYANSAYTAPEIKVCLLDAIADYKSIYGGEHV
ncbi:hypothetical protein [Acinetobacter venetianus]|uniref:hypothetical protein n=1 Tax=Acinetobacter venetianus TaxID=52133 RepID=UPI00214FF915|nr:hypothetical protein [Acinetobacter venetianus]MCR4532722.1 hypothetical protein [Acinetobacter venetianus]